MHVNWGFSYGLKSNMLKRPNFILFYTQVLFMCKTHTFLAADCEFEVMPISKSSKINGLLKRIFLFFEFSLKLISAVNSSPIL